MSVDNNKLERVQLKSTALYFNDFFHHVHYSCAYALKQLKLHTLCKMRYHLDLLFKFTLFLNAVLFIWKVLVSDSVLGISETFLWSMSVVRVKISLLLDMLRLFMLCVVALFCHLFVCIWDKVPSPTSPRVQ
jgi:hypothetical protein